MRIRRPESESKGRSEPEPLDALDDAVSLDDAEADGEHVAGPEE